MDEELEQDILDVMRDFATPRLIRRVKAGERLAYRVSLLLGEIDILHIVSAETIKGLRQAVAEWDRLAPHSRKEPTEPTAFGFASTALDYYPGGRHNDQQAKGDSDSHDQRSAATTKRAHRRNNSSG